MKHGILLIAPKSLTKLKNVIREITGRSRGHSIESVIAELNLKLPGWVRYFQLAACENVLRKLDSWIRRKLRCIKLKQCKRVFTIATMLRHMGVKEYQAWILAGSGKGWWRLSAAPQAHQAMNLIWFRKQRLISLEELYVFLRKC